MIPRELKGVDMVMYQSFHTHGMRVEVLPLFDTSPLDKADEDLFEKEAEICEEDPENHIAIDFDGWQCQTCQEGFPTLEEYKQFIREDEGRITRVGLELYSLRIGSPKDKKYRFNIQGGIDEREWQRPLVEEVCIFMLYRSWDTFQLTINSH